ncbi:MAG: hypothetical protein R2770_15050 [Acidimicrobiales bacterium]
MVSKNDSVVGQAIDNEDRSSIERRRALDDDLVVCAARYGLATFHQG